MVLSLGPRLIASVASAKLIESYGPWMPLWLSLGFTVLAAALSCFLLEPMKKQKVDEDPDGDSNTSDQEAPAPLSATQQLRSNLTKRYQNFKSGAVYLLRRSNGNMIRLTICYLLTTLAWQSASIIEQLIRRRFSWTWGEVGDHFS